MFCSFILARTGTVKVTDCGILFLTFSESVLCSEQRGFLFVREVSTVVKFFYELVSIVLFSKRLAL